MRPPIQYGSRSEREGKPWQCSRCHAQNNSVQKLVFNIPKFLCSGCGKSFFYDNSLDFSLADVDVNGISLIQRIFKQRGDQCMESAICQNLQMMYTVACILKKKQLEGQMLKLSPGYLHRWYAKVYPMMTHTDNEDSDHKFIKLLLNLRKEGIRLKDGSFYKVGDVSSIPKDAFEAICEELADGVPLLTTLLPGCSFEELGYCQIYCPPNWSDAQLCEEQSPRCDGHDAHTVVLVGVATNDEQRGFYFVNSWGLWCPRFVLEQGGSKTYHGVAKLLAGGLIDNCIKLWQPDETAGASSSRFEDEDEGLLGKYVNLPSNLKHLNG